MRQLNGLDAAFLYTEVPGAPLHVGGLAIYQPQSRSRLSFAAISAHIVERGRFVPAMNERLVTVPLNLDHPYWTAEEPFDPAYHIRRSVLPKPGNWVQLCDLVSRIHAEPLDRSRPLWEFHIIEGINAVEGYPRGCFGMLSKIHHATIDGAAGAEIGAALHDIEASGAGDEPIERDPVSLQTPPSTPRVLLRAQINAVTYPFKFARTVARSLPPIARAASGSLRGTLKPVLRAPRTVFNGNVSPERVFGSERFSLSELLKLKSQFTGVTLNDVALAISGGALRKYLQRQGKLPGKSLVAAVPVSLRSEGSDNEGGNQVTNMSVAIRTDIEDPLTRLLAVNEASQNAKAFTQVVGARTLTGMVEMAPSALTGIVSCMAADLRLAHINPPSFNLSITNVPQSRHALYFCGARMLGNFGVGPILHGIGIFQIINSYCDELSISFTSCKKMMPDPQLYAGMIREAHDELVEAALGAAT